MTESCAVAIPSRLANPTVRLLSSGTLFIFPTPVPYAGAWALQSRLHQERLLDLRPDTVLILEHQPVYTLGRSTRTADWGGDETFLRANGAELHRVNRGGSVTYHGPGQLLVYPILKLARHAAGPKQLVWLFEEVILGVLTAWGIDGRRIDKKPGIWVMTPEPAKIASIGIRIEHGVTLHGFALNVHLDLAPFRAIHPCGFPDCRITTMGALANAVPALDAVKHDLSRTFGAVFGLEWTTIAEHPDRLLMKADETVSIGIPPDPIARTYAGA